MPVLKITTFGGISPKIPPRYLKNEAAQVAFNCPMWNGSLTPISDLGSSVHALTKSGVPRTIYRFGQDTVSDDRYWFHWNADVDVCRGQIAGDASEWTFFTGDGVPKATYNSLALATGNYPTNARPLGLPAPTIPATATAAGFDPESYAAKVVLTEAHIAEMNATNDVLVSTTTDTASAYTTVNLTLADMTAAHVRSKINALAGITAVVDEDTVKVTTDATGVDAKLFVKFQTGTEFDTEGSFTADTAGTKLDLSGSGTADTDAYVVIEDGEIGSIGSGDTIEIVTEAGEVFSVNSTGTKTATTLTSFINSNDSSNKILATKYGSCVVITPRSEGGGQSGFIEYKRTSNGNVALTSRVDGSEAAAPAYVFVKQSDIDEAQERFIRLKVNNNKNFTYTPATATVNDLLSLAGYGVTVEMFGQVEPFAVVKTNTVGANVSLELRSGLYPNDPIYSVQSGEGYVDEDQTLETRIYTYTWVNKESGFTFESAPAGASNGVEVRAGQGVNLSGLEPNPGGEYVVTNRRIYRSVSGVYLFVKELPASSTSFTDDVLPESLAEELPTLTWSAPPSNLAGLTNLPNGMMAGFVGRDVYFCDPYHPHAWPEQYIQTLDYPVVGLGRMDTTLAVLTTGVPYLVQGSHPTTMAVVKSDLQQACVSKRSIVSHGGAVMYAAPDGLMMLSPGGSKIVTEQLFDRAQWQSFFRPESIHAYAHDKQYIAFYDNGTTQGGFIYDMTSGNIVTHDIYAEAAFHDLQRDKLFVALADRSVRVWGEGGVKSYIWRSKKFTMPKPLSFGWAQLEAEAYSMVMKFYVDGTLAHTRTVSSRDPFRLPVVVGRDWEVQVEGTHEVFSLALAHSAAELRDG